jgi:hypothetical protein
MVFGDGSCGGCAVRRDGSVQACVAVVLAKRFLRGCSAVCGLAVILLRQHVCASLRLSVPLRLRVCACSMVSIGKSH